MEIETNHPKWITIIKSRMITFSFFCSESLLLFILWIWKLIILNNNDNTQDYKIKKIEWYMRQNH